jgi:hypothetical protein
MKREQDEGSVVSSGSGNDRPPEVLQIPDAYANKVRGDRESGGDVWICGSCVHVSAHKTCTKSKTHKWGGE